MAAPYNPPIKGEDFGFDVMLEDYTNPGQFRRNPTLAAGDVKISKDNGAWANLNTLPALAPSSPITHTLVSGILSATEMNADKVTVLFRDQTVPPEWCDYSFTILTRTS